MSNFNKISGRESSLSKRVDQVVNNNKNWMLTPIVTTDSNNFAKVYAIQILKV